MFQSSIIRVIGRNLTILVCMIFQTGVTKYDQMDIDMTENLYE